MSEWISVEDRLPKRGVRVFVWFDKWVSGQRTQIMHRAWIGKTFYDDDGRAYGIQPTHWTPLLDPPKE